MPRKYPCLKLYLCTGCAAHYYTSPCRRIRPAPSLYPTFGICDLCRRHYGELFHITLPS